MRHLILICGLLLAGCDVCADYCAAECACAGDDSDACNESCSEALSIYSGSFRTDECQQRLDSLEDACEEATP